MSEPHNTLRLEGVGRSWFAEWLTKGISCHEFGDCPPGADPFPGAQHLFGMHEQLVDYLALVHAQLDSGQRQDFVAGVAEALRTLNLNSDRHLILASRLLSLASRLGAKEGVHVLAYNIDISRDDQATKRLIQELATAICAWPLPIDNRTKEALYRLSRSSAFDAILARRALPALCKADPEGLCTHLQILHPQLQERYAPQLCRENPKRSEERTKRVLEVHDIVPSEVFARAFEDWRSRVPFGHRQDTAAQSLDWWLASVHDPRVLYVLTHASADERPSIDTSYPTKDGHDLNQNEAFPFDEEDEAHAENLLDESPQEPVAA